MANYNSRVFHNRSRSPSTSRDDYVRRPSNRQAIIPGQHQNQHIRFGDDERLPREPRAMKRNREGQDNNVGSKRMKIEEVIERDIAAHAHNMASGEHHQGSEERNWHQDGDHYGRQGELRITGASRQERFPLSTGRDTTTAKQVEIINIDEGDELDCLGPEPPHVTPRPLTPPKSVNSKYQGGYGGFGVAGHILGFLKGSLNSPVSPTTLPPASQGLSDSERQDLLEQAAQSRMELAHVMELLNKERRRGDKLQNELSKAQAGEHQVQGAEERARTEMQKALDELQQARIVDQRHKSQLMVFQEEQTRLMTKLTEADGLKKKMEAKIRILLREKAEATKCLHIATAKEAQTPTPVKISLDVFDNTLDQVSEAHVKVSGHPSISGLNDSLDNLVSVVLEQAPNLAAAYTGYRASVSETESDLPPAMVAALAMTDLTEDNRGLLLDASLHHIVLRQLYSLFFYGEGVAIVIEETDILEQVLQYVTRDETWSASQRFRAILASNASKMYGPSLWEDQVQRTAGEIIRITSWAYGVPAMFFESIEQNVTKELSLLFRDAHELSVVLKRDILSVRMSVVLASRQECRFNPQEADSIWPEMGVKPGDDILGDYSLGLNKRTKTGETTFSTLPKVFTTALIREVVKK